MMGVRRNHDARAVHRRRARRRARSTPTTSCTLSAEDRMRRAADGTTRRWRVGASRRMPMRARPTKAQRRRRRRPLAGKEPKKNEHQRRPRGRHRLDRADHLPAARNGREPGHASSTGSSRTCRSCSTSSIRWRATTASSISASGPGRIASSPRSRKPPRSTATTSLDEQTQVHRTTPRSKSKRSQQEFRDKIAELENRTDLDPRVSNATHGTRADRLGARCAT